MTKTPSATAALSDSKRLAEIRRLKREIKKLLKRGEAVYLEHRQQHKGMNGYTML